MSGETATEFVAWCPACPMSLLVHNEGDAIEHVGPILHIYPWGEHRFIPATEGGE